MTPQDVEQAIQEVLAHHIELGESFVFLFGSRAAGRGQRGSDYDIGVLGKRPLSLMTIAKIKDELEGYPLPVEVDVVDFLTASEDFKRLALREVKIWNQPTNNWRVRSMTLPNDVLLSRKNSCALW